MKKTLQYLLTAAVAVALLQTAPVQTGNLTKPIKTKDAATKKKKFDELVNVVANADHEKVKQYLIENVKEIKTYINEKDESENTILTTAITSGNSARTIRLLILSGAGVNASAKSTGDTPLHLAVGTTNIPVMELLLTNGADINAQNQSKQTPLDVAVELQNVALIKYLIMAAGKTATTQTISEVIQVAQKAGYTNIEKMLQTYLTFRNGKLSGRAFLKYLDNMPLR